MKAALTVVFVAVIAAWGIYGIRPPEAVPASAPASEFSAARAHEHLRAFARQPHPVGSAAHDAVREYIVNQLRSLGVEPQVETGPVAMDARWGFPLSAATISDIIVRLPGSASTRTLALMCHYDSVSSGPGASDDGEGVAVLLETLRALRTGPPLRNNLVFLFTDGEETGLLGAKAFVDAHSTEVGLVLDFEARGSSGPAFMFETSGGNGWMVRQLAEAAPYPRANSLTYEAYRNMPNDTDLTIFKKAGIPGLNFAFIGDVTNYHSQLDDPQHIDERSLQHQGSYALSLARHFGNQDLRQVTASDVTYFNLPGLPMVIYPISWSLPLAVAAGALLAVAFVAGMRRGRISAAGILAGFGGFLLTAVVVTAAVAGLWRIVLAIHPDYRQMLQGDPYHAGVYRSACMALAIAIFAGLYNWMRRRVAVTSLWCGALVVWVALAIVSAIYAAGASYIFTWPLLFSIAGLGFLVAKGEKLDSWPAVIVIWACAAPGLALLSPTIDQLFVAMTMRLAPVPAMVTALLLGLLIPHLGLAASGNRWWLPGGAALLAVACLIAGGPLAAFSREQPKPDSLFYGLDADTGTASWFSGDFQVDPWVKPVLGNNPQRVSGSPFIPFLTWNFYVNRANPVALAAPSMERLEDNTEAGVRTLRLRIASHRGAPVLFVYGDPRATIVTAAVNGKNLGKGMLAPADKPGLRVTRFHRWSFEYANPPKEGIELRVQVKAPAAPLRMEVIDQSYSLEGIPGVPARPADTIPLAWTPDSIYVRKSFAF